MILLPLLLSLLLSSCTLSLQNISTHGTASDVSDTDQEATADVKPALQVPLK